MSNAFLSDFPLKNQTMNGKRLVYLDNAATTQKPYAVLKAMEEYYKDNNANPHRGAYDLSVRATDAYENARITVQKFIGAKEAHEIIFTRNASEAINLVMYTYGIANIKAGDEILISIAEHHSNLVPWQIHAKQKGAELKYVYLNEYGTADMDELKAKITEKTKIVAINHVSNVLGTINPVKEITRIAHEKGAVVVVDGAQSVPHFPVDVLDIDADFMAFSGHKMFGPMGIGVLYGKSALLEKMPPFLYGGDMIEYVREQDTTFAPLPAKFEAGTPNVGGAVGIEAAIKYINEIGFSSIMKVEEEITAYALEKMQEVPYLDIYAKNAKKRAGVISFNVKDIHPHDVSTILDADGVAIRAGHHCAHPLMTYLKTPATCRASFYVYNTKEDIDVFVESLKKVRKVLGYGSK